jgi:hypothetical protein
VIARVVLRDGLSERELSVAQFLQLPLDQRIQLLLEHKIAFYDAQQKPIERQDAMKQLRDVRR